MKVTRQEQIDAILDNFDFEKVHKAMDALNWTYGDKEPVDVPELRKLARRLLKSVSNEDIRRISTGGFVAEKHHDKKGTILELKFCIDDISGDHLFDNKTEYE